MTKTRFVRLAALLGSVVLAGGCSGIGGVSCLAPPDAKDSRDLPPLRIPAGLDALDTRAALKVPELNEPEAPRGPKSRCLEDPPSTLVPASTVAPPAKPAM